MNSPYQTTTNLYSHTSVPWQQDILDDFLKRIEIYDGFSCIDVGTGVGNNLTTLLKYCKNINAVDVSEIAMEKLRKKYNKNLDKITVKKMSAEDLDYLSGSFDLVICTEVLEHCLNIKKTLSECARVLKSGGYLIISSPNYFNLAGIVKIIKENIYPRKTWDAWGNHEAGIENFLTSFKIKKLIRDLRFDVVDQRGGDLIRSWVPFFKCHYKIIDRHPSLTIGQCWPLRMFMMNYFILARKSF